MSVYSRVDIRIPRRKTKMETGREASATILALFVGQKWDQIWLRRAEIVCEEINELELQLLATRAQLSTALGRIKLLEGIIAEAALKSGVGS